MGFDSTIVLAQVVQTATGEEITAYPEVTIEMPRWGWQWATDRHELNAGPQLYRLMLPGEPDGVAEDSYGVPLRAMRPRALLDYIKTQHRDSYHLPAVAALRAMLKRVHQGDWSGEYVVLCLGH